MSTDIQNLYMKHGTLLQQRRTETPDESLIEEAESLIEELSEAVFNTFDETIRQRLSSYVTYWRNFVFEETGVYPKAGSLLSVMKSSEEASRAHLTPTIGIITALPKEYAAVKVMLNQPTLSRGAVKGKSYTLGNIPAVSGGNHVVVLSLTDMGNNIAADRIRLLLEDFPKVNLIILTGIAGGIPNPSRPAENVRLGDVVVSDQTGLVQFDLYKEGISEFGYRQSPRPPSSMLLEAVNLLQAAQIQGEQLWLKYVVQGVHSLGISLPVESALSFDPARTMRHSEGINGLVGQPRVFVGRIATSNRIQKNSSTLEELRDRFAVKAVEMEGSGIANVAWTAEVGYLVVRGICDYLDMTKSDNWQDYAAIVAAAYTRGLVETIPAASA